MKYILFKWVPLIMWSSIIFYLSTRPIYVPVGIDHVDLLFHFVCYLVLAVLCCRVLSISQKEKKIPSAVVTVTLPVIYGALLELYQGYIPTRTPSMADIIANSSGAIIGVVAYLVWQRLRMPKTEER